MKTHIGEKQKKENTHWRSEKMGNSHWRKARKYEKHNLIIANTVAMPRSSSPDDAENQSPYQYILSWFQQMAFAKETFQIDEA